MGIFSQSL